MKILRLVAILLFAARGLAAQAPAATGVVTGHVFLGDSHAPARLATISLISTRPTQPTQPNAAESAPRDTAWSAHVQSTLDGSFTIPNVPPGDYYFLAEKAGYISPGHLAQGPYYMTKEEEDSLAKQVAPITVFANRTTTVNTILVRGASISGSVRFDDGSPDAEGRVALLHKDKNGKWVPYLPATTAFNPSPDGGNLTDDQGRFRFAGLPAGEYLLKSILETGPSIVRDNNADGDAVIHDSYAIDCYYGDSIRQKDAKVIKVIEGQQLDGNNIEIPLARLHSVSGTVISLETSATVNSATLELRYADDDSLAAQTNETAAGFNFFYVPEGTYTIKVTHAADVDFAADTHEADVNGVAGRVFIANRPRTLRNYTDISQPLIVNGQTSDVLLQAKPEPVTATAGAQ